MQSDVSAVALKRVYADSVFAAAPDAISPGTLIDNRYRIEGLIAKSRMSSVYRASAMGSGESGAIKFLRQRGPQSDIALRRFQRETKVLSRLSHPRCVALIDAGICGSPYVVMEFVSGQTLAELIRGGPVPFPRAVGIVEQVLDGLSHAHSHGYVHRDIKPANIMLGRQDAVSLLDFGLSQLGDDQELSAQGKTLGTPPYMAPEQLVGRPAGYTADIYATGVVLFELLTGRHPYHDASSLADLLRRKRDETAPRLGDVEPEIRFPPSLEKLVARALERSPRARFSAASEFADALKEVGRPQVVAMPVKRAPTKAKSSALSLDTIEVIPAELAPESKRPSSTVPVRAKKRRVPWKPALALLILGGIAGAFAFVPEARELAISAKDRAFALFADDEPGEAASAIPDEPVQQPAADTVSEAPAPPVVEETAPSEAVEQATTKPTPDSELFASSEDHTPIGMVAATQEPVPEPAPEPAKESKPTLKQARKLIAKGKHSDALAVLSAIERERPLNAYAAYLMGNALFGNKEWTAGVVAYERSITLSRRYGRNKTVLSNLLTALSGRRSYPGASKLLKKIGRPAARSLRSAAKAHKNRLIRRRAQSVLRSMAPKRRSKRSKRRSKRRRR